MKQTRPGICPSLSITLPLPYLSNSPTLHNSVCTQKPAVVNFIDLFGIIGGGHLILSFQDLVLALMENINISNIYIFRICSKRIALSQGQSERSDLSCGSKPSVPSYFFQISREEYLKEHDKLNGGLKSRLFCANMNLSGSMK